METTLRTRTRKTRKPKVVQYEINYISLDDLDRQLEEGVSLERLKNLERFWTASNIPVKEHIEYLDAIKALKFEGDMVRVCTVQA